jgi:hypothetical protein
MKRFWLVLLSLGLVMAFSASAFAVDVKFSGEFYAAGLYMDRVNVSKDPTIGSQTSTAFYYQRLRLKAEFVVAPGLSLITRANVMERAWGAARSTPTSGMAYNASGLLPGANESAGSLAENENIAFDWAYIHYVSPIGIWDVGYMLDGPWGTKFGDSDYANARVFWILPLGNTGFMLAAGVVKLQDKSDTAKNVTLATDRDSDKYAVGALYVAKGVEVGILAGYWRYAGNRASGYSTVTTSMYPFYLIGDNVLNVYGALPYAKLKLGPVDLEAELWWLNGTFNYENSAAGIFKNASIKVDNNIMAYVDATVNLGMFYLGGMAIYCSGDNPETTDKVEGSLFGTGKNLEPTLIMFSANRAQWVGSLNGNKTYGDAVLGQQYASTSFQMTNGYMLQGRFGIKPTDKLDMMVKVTWAEAATSPTVMPGFGSQYTWVDKNYGTEVDVIATYKITNNLSYMLGAGYLFTGGFYKGVQGGVHGSYVASPGGPTQDDYMLINKLTLTF